MSVVASIESGDIASGELRRWFLCSAALTLIVRVRHNQSHITIGVGGPPTSTFLLPRASHLLLSQRSPYSQGPKQAPSAKTEKMEAGKGAEIRLRSAQGVLREQR